MPVGNEISKTLRSIRFLLTATLITSVLLISVGCGGGSSSPSNPNPTLAPTPPPAATTSAQVRLGDAPADRVVSFEVTVGPITMTPTGGSPVTVLSGTRRLEMTHLSATSEPLALLNVPQGNYSSASITVSNPEVVFVNNVGTLVKLQPALNTAITINFSPALSMGASATVLKLDLNVASSLTFDVLGNVTGVSLSASSFTVSTTAVAAGNQQNDDDGEIEDTTGMVTAVSGSTFTLSAAQGGPSLIFNTDANTQFNDGATLGTMLNTIVKVEGFTNADGSLYAKEVEGIENANGVELEGLVTQISGNPAAQLTFITDEGVGSGMDDTKIGSTLTVDVSGRANYKVSKGNIDTSGIGGLPSPPNFPFDATTIHAGQRIEIESISGLSGTSIIAEKVKLQQQAVRGTVSGLSGPTSSGPVSFMLTLPADSAFAMLSGQTAVTVFWQPGTDLHNLTDVSNGDSVRVRGLVFFTGTSFNMIARRIDQ
jgi:hypothetical protein